MKQQSPTRKIQHKFTVNDDIYIDSVKVQFPAASNSKTVPAQQPEAGKGAHTLQKQHIVYFTRKGKQEII